METPKLEKSKADYIKQVIETPRLSSMNTMPMTNRFTATYNHFQ
jgi:hypothetical protein